MECMDEHTENINNYTGKYLDIEYAVQKIKTK